MLGWDLQATLQHQPEVIHSMTCWGTATFSSITTTPQAVQFNQHAVASSVVLS
jgi:hypothetical protein